MKKLTILGSTGSIGSQTLDVVRQHPGDFEITALTAGCNVDKMVQQIREFHPVYAVMKDEKTARLLQERLNESEMTRILSGMDGFCYVSTLDEVDVVVASMVGMIGLKPVIQAIRAGKDIALANKETLVTAGHIIIPLAKEKHVRLLPVDSEHSAIFQCLQGQPEKKIEKIYLTASGGPFRHSSPDELKQVTVEQALAHPNWSMGPKITTDSATMINKGLEMIEAKWLFSVDLDQIHVLIQPQSVIHSMVEYQDGAVLAQLGTPDMRLPIQYALYYPERRPLNTGRVDFFELGKITFEKPDFENFRGLKLAYEAASQGGNIPTAFNAANEVAVRKFLNREIAYLDIPEMIAYAMEQTAFKENPDVAQILETERAVTELLESRW